VECYLPAGYGLTVPELNYDDLAGQDLKGKIVVFVTGGPTAMPGPIKAHYQSSEERRKALLTVGVIGTIAIPNPKSAHIRNFQLTKIDHLNSRQNPALDPVYNARQSRYVLPRTF
jgi:hypothetical protein